MSELTVYKASAGSGKTFTLAVEYIKFLIKDPLSYRNILAVTFTNKATDEMKMRILGQLYGISHSLPDSEDYLKKIMEETGTDEPTVRNAAALALTQLVHNYDYFHVQTIDTFFQSVLRNLAKELDLSANLKIELNDTKIETLAVDAMIEELDRKSSLFSWLLRFVMENIDDNKGWDVVKAVRKFGLKIYDNDYRNDSVKLNSKLAEKDFYDKFTKQLTLMKKELKDKLVNVNDEFLKTLEENGLQLSALKGGNNIASYFRKLVGDDLSDKNCLTVTVKNCLADEQNWVKKSDKHSDRLIPIVTEKLMPLMKMGENLRKEAKFTLSSVDATLQNLRNMLMLNDIEKKVREMNSEANRFLLSDTQYLLHKMISDSDSPFIFEKIGTRLQHIMIDEFQDTSTVQWQNFKILLDECMSHGNSASVNNLIVGDVKQSIYRWRAGDWQLLGNIEDSFSRDVLDVKRLNTNFRSAHNIVAFNNIFFKTAVKLEVEKEKLTDSVLAEKINEAYSDVEQKINKQNTEGLVRVKLLPADEYYTDNTISEIESIVDELLLQGVKQSNIAILLRNKKYIPLIANYFTENRPDISIVSDEAFRLDHSTAINTIVAALRLLYSPDDSVTRFCLVKYYQRFILENKCEDLDMMDEENIEKLLPEEYVKGCEELKKLPLYDLAEKIFSIFCIDRLEGDSAYVCAFFDSLSSYISDMSADVVGFLKDWDDNLHSNKIQSDEAAGIQMMSIHASKGLEFDNVIIPFCDWMLERFTDSYIWGHPTQAPYNELPILSMKYSPKLNDSVYSDDYRNEHMQNTMDNLNLLYVAFTRAGKNLFVMGKRDSSKTRSMLIQNSIQTISEELEGAWVEGVEDQNECIDFCFGEFMPSREKNEKESENVFLKSSKREPVKVNSHEIPVVFRQSNKSKDFVDEIAGEANDRNQKRQSYVKIGNVLHLVFSNIHTANDIDSVLDKFEAEGVLYGNDLDRNLVQKMLKEYLSADKMVADWFSGRWTLYNECSILSINEATGTVETKRPDRVMKDGDTIVVVDFKFGKMHESYNAQVAEYMRLIENMGYKDVKGYIWLVNERKTIEVKKD